MSYLYNYWGTEPIILFFSFLSTIGQTFVYEGQLSFGGQNCISLINIYSLIFIWQKKKKNTMAHHHGNSSIYECCKTERIFHI